MADFENMPKRKKKRCKSAHPDPGNLPADKNLLKKRKRPKSTGRNLDILDRKYLELREIVLGSIAALFPMEKLLVRLAMQENKRLGQILNNKSSQLLPLNQSIQASRIYKKAFGDFSINGKGSRQNADISRSLPPVIRSNFKICCCGNCEREGYKPKKHEDSDEHDKKKTNKQIPQSISRSTNSLTSFANASDNSDNKNVHRSLVSRLNSSKGQDSFNNKLHLTDDTYRWHNCNQEIRNWLKEKNKELRQKKSEERQLAKKEEEKAKQEKEALEAQKLESREKVRSWLDQRRKKNKSEKFQAKKVSSAESFVENINTTSNEILNNENILLRKESIEILPGEIKLDALATSVQTEEIKSDDSLAENYNEGLDNPRNENEICAKVTDEVSDEAINPVDANVLESNEPHMDDFQKLLSDFTKSDEPQTHPVLQNQNSYIEFNSPRDTEEALIKHEMDLNQHGMVNEWLFDSGRLIDDTKMSEPDLCNTDKHIESTESPQKISSFPNQSVDESRKSIKITHFDLLRGQAEDNLNQKNEKIDLEQFKRLIIHDGNDSENNLNDESFNKDQISEGGKHRRSLRRTSATMVSDDEKCIEDDEQNLLKLKRDFHKFDESYRSSKNDMSTGLYHSPRIADSLIRPKTSRRRVQAEKQESLLE